MMKFNNLNMTVVKSLDQLEALTREDKITGVAFLGTNYSTNCLALRALGELVVDHSRFPMPFQAVLVNAPEMWSQCKKITKGTTIQDKSEVSIEAKEGCKQPRSSFFGDTLTKGGFCTCIICENQVNISCELPIVQVYHLDRRLFCFPLQSEAQGQFFPIALHQAAKALNQRYGRLALNTRVVIQGLRPSPSKFGFLNGEVGRVYGFDGNTCRYRVKLQNQQIYPESDSINLRQKNLLTFCMVNLRRTSSNHNNTVLRHKQQTNSTIWGIIVEKRENGRYLVVLYNDTEFRDSFGFADSEARRREFLQTVFLNKGCWDADHGYWGSNRVFELPLVSLVLPPGVCAQLHGLRSAHLNGKWGTVVTWDSSFERYLFRVNSTEILRVRPENVII